MEPRTKWLVSKKGSFSCTMSGVWRAVAFCEGCAVIFHSPSGCVHVAAAMDTGSYYRSVAALNPESIDMVPLVSSNIRERDSIFGGIGRLHDCIAYVMETYKPECLFIASSCVAGVIGDDTDAEAEDAEAEYGIPVISINYAGFLGGEYGDGYFKTAEVIIDRFLKPCPRDEHSVLLLGDQMGPWGQYAKEVKRLARALGFTVKWQFPGYVPFQQWKEIAGASFSILLGNAGSGNDQLLDMAKGMEDRFGIQTLGPIFPTGWENTKQWILAFAKLTGAKEKGNALVEAEEQRLLSYVKQISHVTKGKQAVIGIGRGPRWYDPRDTVEMVLRMEMELSAVVVYDNLTDDEIQWMTERVRTVSPAPILTSREGKSIINEADLLLTTNQMVNIETKQFFIPMVPLAGAGGEIAMMRTIYRLLCRYGNKGGIAYAKG